MGDNIRESSGTHAARGTHTDRIQRLERNLDVMKGEVTSLEQRSMTHGEKLDSLVTSTALMAQSLKHIESAMERVPGIAERQVELEGRTKLAIYVMGVLFVAFITHQVANTIKKEPAQPIKVILQQPGHGTGHETQAIQSSSH